MPSAPAPTPEIETPPQTEQAAPGRAELVKAVLSRIPEIIQRYWLLISVQGPMVFTKTRHWRRWRGLLMRWRPDELQ